MTGEVTREVTRQDRIYCLKASSDYHRELCEECRFYPNCDHMTQDDMTELTIKDLETLEQAPILEKDGTLIVTTEHCGNVGRVLVQYGTNGTLFYQDQEPQPKTGYISIDDVMSVFDDFMRGDADEEGTETFLEMLKDKAESEVEDGNDD